MVQVAEADVRADFNAVFRFCLGDEDEVVRALAIEGLWEDVDTCLIGPLLRLLVNDPAVSVRAAAAISLGRYVLRGELGELGMSQAMTVQHQDIDFCLGLSEAVYYWPRFPECKKAWLVRKINSCCKCFAFH